MKNAVFFECEVRLLKFFCGNYEMYNSIHSTKTKDTIETECWYRKGKGLVKRYLVNVTKNQVELLETFKESENDFLSKLVG